jgi:hypothetical protein
MALFLDLYMLLIYMIKKVLRLEKYKVGIADPLTGLDTTFFSVA